MPNAFERSITRVCVFCGSHAGTGAAYRSAAEATGRALAGAGIEVVYGGGKVGLMGVVADAALAAGGTVVGVIPHRLAVAELVHTGLTDLRIVESMHERKRLMADLADAFVALPGGYGTFEEFWEVVTWTQLGIHQKPCGLLNVAGFYDPMLAQINRAVQDGFIAPENRALVIAGENVQGLLDTLRHVHLPHAPRWANRPAP